jgi:hypothetical protein
MLTEADLRGFLKAGATVERVTIGGAEGAGVSLRGVGRSLALLRKSHYVATPAAAILAARSMRDPTRYR